MAKRSSSGKSTYSLSMYGPRGDVVHVWLNVLDDGELVRERDVGAGVVEDQYADLAPVVSKLNVNHSRP